MRVTSSLTSTLLATVSPSTTLPPKEWWTRRTCNKSLWHLPKTVTAAVNQKSNFATSAVPYTYHICYQTHYTYPLPPTQPHAAGAERQPHYKITHFPSKVAAWVECCLSPHNYWILSAEASTAPNRSQVPGWLKGSEADQTCTLSAVAKQCIVHVKKSPGPSTNMIDK